MMSLHMGRHRCGHGCGCYGLGWYGRGAEAMNHGVMLSRGIVNGLGCDGLSAGFELLLYLLRVQIELSCGIVDSLGNGRCFTRFHIGRSVRWLKQNLIAADTGKRSLHLGVGLLGRFG